MKHPYFTLCTLLVGILCCITTVAQNTLQVTNETPVRIFNFDDRQAREAYLELKLDDTHPNLLNPEISGEDIKSVMDSWVDLHKRIGTYLSENDFYWGVDDSSITIIQKIYFNPNGEIENYFFKIQNASVTKEKKEEFGQLLADFAASNKIVLQKEENFAQCGKTKYINE